MRAIIFTTQALFRMSQFSITEKWFEKFEVPPTQGGLKRIAIEGTTFILADTDQDDSAPLVVIELGSDYPVFLPERANLAVFERAITVARATYTNSVNIPATWKPYKEANLLSIKSSPRSKEFKSRLHFCTHPNTSQDLLVFARTEDVIKFADLQIPLQLHKIARLRFADAILTDAPILGPPTTGSIELSERLPQGFVQGASLEQWYASKLTTEQRDFVDRPHDGPVRLRGAAGTGKTISLVVKFLRDGLQFERAEQKQVKLGFITHSVASVDLVSAIAESLDRSDLIHGKGRFCKLEIRTIYDIAHDHLKVDSGELQPLSLDGREGRRLQFELISSVLKELWASSIARDIDYKAISGSIKIGWREAANGGGSRFIAEIMNEFASVLDAEGIRSGEARAERYSQGKLRRPPWLMPLSNSEDRRFMLEVHRRYRQQLAEMKTISIDQMISDFSTFLESHRWAHVRSRLGYDALFVDELHLFTPIERQTLHKIIKEKVVNGTIQRPAIFMAYDLKQSPRDTFSQYYEEESTLFSPNTGLQNAQLVKLEKVFRYTPQIAEFLTDLDASFPAVNVPAEWDAYVGKAQLDSGNVPELVQFGSEVELFRAVFGAAIRRAMATSGGGRRIAVLCVSEELFDKYLTAASGQFADKFFPVVDRQPTSELRHANKRFIFSMPEYVAGLQFEAVYLIGVDPTECPNDAGLGAKRRFMSSIYLGASRAEKTLTICASLDRGGQSDVLSIPLNRKSLLLSKLLH